MSGHQFRWQEHGPQDYAESCYTFAMSRKEDRHELNGTERTCLEHLLCLFGKVPGGRQNTPYLTFGRAYLARVLGRSIRQVARVLRRLSDLGYLVRLRRKPQGNTPQSTLTKPGPSLLSLLYRTAGEKLQRFRKRTKTAHNDLKKGNRSRTTTAPSSPLTTEMKVSVPATDALPLQGGVQPDTEPEGKPEREQALKTYQLGIEQIRLALEAKRAAFLNQQAENDRRLQERRIELKRQAELLKARGL